MKHCFSMVLVMFLCGVATAQPPSTPAAPKPATLMQGYGDLHHAVTTSNDQAQQFFDQGLRQIYAFNHDEAARSFQRAAELDPKLAMAYWGIAEAVGPNYNDPASEARFQAAHEAIEKAAALSAGATEGERAYIGAMAKRFPADLKADRRKAAEEYHEAMKQVMRQHPDDLDAATLFAESGMDLHPWGLWHLDGTPEEGTDEIIAALESVIRRDPNHMGAVHYYIHAVEASPNPERALAAANRLASLAPAAGHLVHMPSHVYVRTGDYQAAVETNQRAAAADQAYLQASGVQGVYPMMYYSHNLHFIAYSASMNGDYAEARKAADELARHVGPLVKDMPPLEAFLTVPMAVELRFHRWAAILEAPEPGPDRKVTAAMRHLARGMAFAETGKPGEAENEYRALVAIREAIPPTQVYSMPFNNRAADVLDVEVNVLGGRIALARKDTKTAVSLFEAAIVAQDKLKYSEPPDWFIPVRELLGGALLSSGSAVEAEKMFREDLARHPRNPRSLFGLWQSLKDQHRDYDAQFVEKEFRSAWKGNLELKLDDLT